MKIGILTFHRALNYGAVLQCYALYSILNDLGHDVKIIDYRPDYVEYYRKIIPVFKIKRTQGFSKKLRLILASLLWGRSTIEATKRFDNFILSHFAFTKIVKSREQVPNDFDVIIVGSDQVWSPQICYGFDPVFWGQFPHKQIVLSSYAASMEGLSQLSHSDWHRIMENLKSFSHISVREMQLQKELNKRLTISCECNIDPSLLLNEDAYESIIEEPSVEGDYVLVFSVVQAPGLMDFANAIAKKMNIKVVVVYSQYTPKVFRKKGDGKVLCPSIGGFLGLIKKARCVLTTSFHGTAFSIILRRPFYTACHGKGERVRSLLSQLDLNDRLIDFSSSSIESFCFSDINFSDVNIKLDNMRKDSMRYLNSALKMS